MSGQKKRSGELSEDDARLVERWTKEIGRKRLLSIARSLTAKPVGRPSTYPKREVLLYAMAELHLRERGYSANLLATHIADTPDGRREGVASKGALVEWLRKQWRDTKLRSELIAAAHDRIARKSAASVFDAYQLVLAITDTKLAAPLHDILAASGDWLPVGFRLANIIADLRKANPDAATRIFGPDLQELTRLIDPLRLGKNRSN
jgi:hypothetical protein